MSANIAVQPVPIPHLIGTIAGLEFCARSMPSLACDRWLSDQGVDVRDAVNVAGPIIPHDVILMPRGIFSFADDGNGVTAIVMMVAAVNGESVQDLIAWEPMRPRRVFRYLGAADALGLDQLGNPASYLDGQALPVHLSPLDWLKAGCTGIVVLDRAAFRQRVHNLSPRAGGYRLLAANLPHARALRTMLGPFSAHAKLYVREADLFS